ncbi:peroxiredoxin family protein [Tenacibaculum jejuense]|uniref:Probable lipoprotein n=1 Tax=Tenacibaculum jejuense TaxID=584609 RepID=A0A238UBV7_9FLAO|nr:TlpA disulfide reductase family protein [Tenacibaculum jejuense]SNR15964.1 Probable lipoprotein precursor [Tenacibaculum jejuense]
MKPYIALFIAIIITSCTTETKKVNKLEKGTYRAALQIQDQKEIPFIFEVINENELHVFNAEETIKVHEITYNNDSVKIQMPFFEGYLTAKIKENRLTGEFVKSSLDRIVPFTAEKSTDRFASTSKSKVNITGNWETVFSPNSEEDKYIAKGIFKQEGDKVTGTFRTTTGDYRFLEGNINNDILQLSTFDGAHAFLFTAKVTDSTMNGHFYSGNHWKEPFTAKLNNNYELPDAESLTYLRDGYETISFSFPDKNDTMVSLTDDRFKDKVTVVQIMGSWCPNCLDESKYYSEYYAKNKSKGIEFVALAFEVAKTKEEAFEYLNRFEEQTNITYPILLAQFGSSNKISAQEKLPMLNHVLSYPTTIILDRKGKVRKIHTGFNGPATGKLYTDFTKNFDSFLNELVNE